MNRPLANEPHVDPGIGGTASFRTAFETKSSHSDAAIRVQEQLRTWLKSKGLDVGQFDSGSAGVGPRSAVRYIKTNDAAGWQLRERRESGTTWLTTVAVTPPRNRSHGAWVAIQVEARAPEGVGIPRVAPPRLVRLILDALDAHDGDAALRSAPIVVTASDVDDLLEVVCDEHRRLPTVVATCPADVAFESWRERIDQLTRGLPGIASVYLIDPSASVVFNQGIGRTHWIGPGAVRTYLPGVDPAIEEDAVRHRVIGRRRIDLDPRHAARVLETLPRQLAGNSIPPVARRSLTLSIRDFAPTQGEMGKFDNELAHAKNEIELLNNILALADENERHGHLELGRQQSYLLDLAVELEVARDELESLAATNRALRLRLVDAGRHSEAYQPVETVQWLPKTFGEILDRLEDLQPAVVFTGDRAKTLDLDIHPQNSTWAQVAWQGLLALHDYVMAKQEGRFDRDFKFWCESPPEDGRAISAGRVARDESSTVSSNKKMARSRTLPVPTSVDPSAKIFMGAHIRLGNSSTIAPRLHFHDGAAKQQVVYVGYIGPHLINTMTS